MKEHLAIKFWAEDERPREKMLLKGRSALSDAELLAIIIGSGTRNLSALELARRLLIDHDHDISKLAKSSIQALMKYPGIGEAKAIALATAFELANRKIYKGDKPVYIRSSKDSYDTLRYAFADVSHEEFYVIYLNRANKIIVCEQLSKGGLSGTVADGKLIFHRALELKSSALILSHNHPSGQLKPSPQDTELTRRMTQFGKMIDIQILDHIIVAGNNYLSFADEGLMNF